MNDTAPPAPPTPPPPPPAAPPGPPQPPLHARRLRRDREHRVLGGVAAGIARTYGIDVTLVRVLWIIAAFLWFGIPAYLVAWIAIPPGEGEASLGDQPRDIGLLIGVALVGIGALIAVEQVLPHGLRGGRFVAPLLLIGGGIAILVLRRPTDEIEVADENSPMETLVSEPATVPAPGPTIEAPAFTGPTPTSAPETPTQPQEPVTAWTQTAPWPTKEQRRAESRARRSERRKRRPRPFLTPLAISLLLIYAGVVSLLFAIDAVTVNLTVVLGIATCFVGAVLLLSTWVGRARGLIFVGLLLVGATAVSTAVDVPLDGGIGERVYRPATVQELDAKYQLGIGHMILDLRETPLVDRDTHVTAQLGIGDLEISVPSTVRVVVTAHAGAGHISMWGRNEDGWDVDANRIAPGSETGTLFVDAKIGTGRIGVRRFLPDGTETLIGGAR